MSLYDYEVSRKLEAEDLPFAALIMAAMRKADRDNTILLMGAFPRIYEELFARYNAPGGRLPHETKPEEGDDK